MPPISGNPAPMYCIQKAGSDRTTVNGWTSWKTQDGKLLAQLRSDYLQKKKRTQNKMLLRIADKSGSI